MTDRTRWLPRAACLGSDPDDFDIITNVTATVPTPTRMDRMWDQGTICESCPVVRECAADALDQRDIGIVRGGVPVVANGSMAWRQMERSALTAMSVTDSPAETRRVWRAAAQRAAAKIRAERAA